MPEYIISNIPVNFPFEPYNVQKRYMEKVIECIETGKNGLLESPTGTGKTLSLLCSSLAWLTLQKAKKQHQLQQVNLQNTNKEILEDYNIQEVLNQINSDESQRSWHIPKIIYASRTHTQITQAMNELKRTNYTTNIKAAVIGSRDQLCIHPDVTKEQSNSNKIQLCKLKVVTRTCTFYQRVETKKEDPLFREQSILDIEDLVTIGRKLKCCPYFVSKQFVDDADIIFMPYNYLLDPKARRANKISLNNTIIILDEAHNVEKMCEESASIQLCSSEIAVCIDDITHIMKEMERDLTDGGSGFNNEAGQCDFTMDDLASLKELLLQLENVVDKIEIPIGKEVTYPGSYMFELLDCAKISNHNFTYLSKLFDNLIQFLTGIGEHNPLFKRGGCFQKLNDLLIVVFSRDTTNYIDKVKRCFKVHIELEEQKSSKQATLLDGGWIQPRGTTVIKSAAKVINYWCFSPGFGMEHLTGNNVRCIILTSGTLAPLTPLISELDISIDIKLENPHIVDKSQVCVKIITKGPDKVILNSNYQNRSNHNYITSLGRTILSFSPVIPGGLLVFFSSYYCLNLCKDNWQASGIWSQIQHNKPIFIESTTKDAFAETMTQYYATIQNPTSKGAIFMAVCRGKVSEGLDFSDVYGRAVIITGLPFPPFKDPRIMLKKQYLEDNRTKANQMLTGDEWYFLEATRTVNQAIGRVIRHRHDYGAIILCDERFASPRIKQKLSSWIQIHLNDQKQYPSFGPAIGDITRFFRNAERTLPQPNIKPVTIELLDSPIKIESIVKVSDTKTSPTINVNPFEKYEAKPRSKIAAKIEDSNSVLEWDPKVYSSSENYTPPAKKAADFFSGLNEQVKTIDFNNITTNNLITSTATSSSPSSSYVRIHKRNRPLSPQSNSYINNDSNAGTNLMEQTKKRKYKLIANNESVNQFYNGSTTTNCNSNTGSNSAQTIVNDRTELLKLIKSSVVNENYNKIVKSVLDYHRSLGFDKFYEILIETLGKPQFHYLLKAMRSFLKEDEHKLKFDNNFKLL